MRPDQQGEAIFLLPDEKLAELLSAIKERGYQLIAPILRDAALCFSEIDGASELPQGLRDAQSPGSYRIKQTASPERFAHASGPTSLKRFLYPPRLKLWQTQRKANAMVFEEPADPPPRYAFIGPRPCDLQAVAIQDRVFLRSAHPDNDYRRRRENALFVAVNCLHPSESCFCSSMNSGPSAKSGFDILLTEQIESEELYYLVQTGTDEGLEILNTLKLKPAADSKKRKAATELKQATKKIERKLDPTGIGPALKERLDSPAWDELENRCLACGNCTLACPTCFCSTVEDHTDLAGEIATRDRVWDSCFQQSFSYVAGGPVRSTIKGRYRQWLTHKLSSWSDQFGTLGCVGCGRCITWCPVGIDLVAEANAICTERQSQNPTKTTIGVSP
ncbi:4Fe-4S binding domain protein [Verrucomicrobiia bacterium DG1235]|nr:4Fe-4S binding domain protein [Verrucomicrobiae bacterium DG1235]